MAGGFIPVNLTNYYRPQTLSIEDEINARSTGNVQFVDKNGLLDIQDGQPLYIYDYEGNLIFGGFTFFPQRFNPIGTNAIMYNVQFVDQQCIADRYLVASSYQNKSAGEIVRDLMNSYLSADGITEGNIKNGEIQIDVAKWVRNVTVSQAIDQLAEMTGFVWYIDYDKKLYFQPRNTTTAGFTISDSSSIVNVNVRQDRSKYRNRQYVRGGTTPTDYQIQLENPTPKPDGTTRSFVLRYPVSERPTIFINNVQVPPSQIGVNGLDGQTTPLQWYFTYNSNVITQDTSQTVLSATDTIQITYTGLIPLLVVVEDEDAITARSSIEGLSGVYEAIEQMPNVNNKKQALDIANGRLKKYTNVERELTYQTFTNGLAAGQLQQVNLSKYLISSGEFLIDRITITDLDDRGRFIYDVHAVDGQAFGGWNSFFKDLIRKDTGVSIKSDERLIVLKSSSEREYWTESNVVNSFTCPIVNDSLSPDDLLYPC